MELELSSTHRRTYDTIFRHPMAHNLQWRDVQSLLDALADVTEEPNGNLKVQRNGQTLVLHAPRGKDIADAEELMQIRHFLERSGSAAPPAASRPHLLIVIDHRQARIYKTELHGSAPQRIVPYDPQGSGRHLHYVEEDPTGQRKPEQKSFYEAVAKTMQGAEKILLFGSGTGASSAMEQLVAELKHHHADLAKRIVGSIKVDDQHSTEDQLLARAREFYAQPAAK